ncbi:MAG: metalloregulator ArsR/SmtB family transcription factor [Aliifodinibius sp.]|nr:metalloregulator ArsR/SmtB family transcription factor [Fodinibius sp.]
MAQQLLPEFLIEQVAQRFKILSEPIRLQLLNQLVANGEMTVMQLVEATGHRQANVSKHLNFLAREGLLKRRKDGLHVYYDIKDPSIYTLCNLVCDRLREEAEESQKRLNEFDQGS